MPTSVQGSFVTIVQAIGSLRSKHLRRNSSLIADTTEFVESIGLSHPLFI